MVCIHICAVKAKRGAAMVMVAEACHQLEPGVSQQRLGAYTLQPRCAVEPRTRAPLPLEEMTKL